MKPDITTLMAATALMALFSVEVLTINYLSSLLSLPEDESQLHKDQ